MNSDAALTTLLRHPWHHIRPRHRGQFMLLLVLLASFPVILSIGAVIPFLGVLTAPERIFEMPVVSVMVWRH